MIPIPIIIGLGTLVAAGALMWVGAEEPGSTNEMADAFGRLERGEIPETPEAFGDAGRIESGPALQTFLAGLPAKSPKQLYNESVRFIVHYLGNFKALRNQGKFNEQYDRFKAAVRTDGGFGPTAMKEAQQGIALIEATSGKTVGSEDRQALAAIAQYQSTPVLQGRA